MILKFKNLKINQNNKQYQDLDQLNMMIYNKIIHQEI